MEEEVIKVSTERKFEFTKKEALKYVAEYVCEKRTYPNGVSLGDEIELLKKLRDFIGMNGIKIQDIITLTHSRYSQYSE